MGERVAAIRSLEAAGAFVQTEALDVSDEAATREFLRRYEAALWPPIRGVIHAAGVLDNELAGSMSRAKFNAVVNPKLRGAQVLDRLLPDLDLFITFSSTGAFLAQPGQANYGAANAGLDALMHDRRARGLKGQSIGWGVWQGTGLVRGHAGERNVSEMARQGIQSLSPEQGTSLFAWLCGRSDTTDVVLPVDWALFHRSRGGRDVPLYRQVVSESDASAAGTGEGLSARLAAASPTQLRELLDYAVRAALGRVLKIAPARIEPRRTFGSMGLGSLDAVELRNRLEEALGRSLSATLAWNYPTLDVLVTHLVGLHAPAATAAPAAAAPVQTQTVDAIPSLGADLQEVAALSEDDALLALRGARARVKR
jgi:myxalamid-type polyketide synthase MxaE and MxaD